MGHPTKLIDAKPLRDLVRLHGMTIPDISKRSDISLSALHTWNRKGEMPAYMAQVCKGLLAEIKGLVTPGKGAKPGDAGPPVTLVVRVPAAESDRAIKLLEAIGAKYRSTEDL